MADHLYRRAAELELDVTDAVNQIIVIASGMTVPVEIDDKRRNAISEVLSFKRDYEVTIATARAVANAPHFTGIAGSWSVKPVQMSNGEVIRVPVLTLSITWHDGLGMIRKPFCRWQTGIGKHLPEKLQLFRIVARVLKVCLTVSQLANRRQRTVGLKWILSGQFQD